MGLDRNGDRKLTAADLVAVVRSLAATVTPTPLSTATTTAVATATPSVSPSATPSATPTATATSSATPTPPGLLFAGTIRELLPHAVGDQLVYRVTTSSNPNQPETVSLLVSSSTTDGRFVVTATVGQTVETRRYLDSGSELLLEETEAAFGTGVVRTRCTPALTHGFVPIALGNSQSRTSTCEVRLMPGNVLGGGYDQSIILTTIAQLDSLVVSAGTFRSVLQMHAKITRSRGGAFQGVAEQEDDVYIAPGVGVIRRVSVVPATPTSPQGTQTFELIDGTIGGVSVRR